MKRKPKTRLDGTREVVEEHERLQLLTKAARTEKIPNQAVVRSPDAMDDLALCRPGVGAGGAPAITTREEERAACCHEFASADGHEAKL